MIRTLFLVISILVVLVTPRPTHGRGGGHDHHRQHRGHHFHHFIGGIYAPFPPVRRAGRTDTGSASSTWTDTVTPPMCPSGLRHFGAVDIELG